MSSAAVFGYRRVFLGEQTSPFDVNGGKTVTMLIHHDVAREGDGSCKFDACLNGYKLKVQGVHLAVAKEVNCHETGTVFIVDECQPVV